MPKSMNAAVLQRCKLFAGCSEAEIKAILEKATFQAIKKGDPVFVNNDPSRFVYLVINGAIDIMGPANVRNQLVRVRTVQPNEHFGELSVLTADRHRTSAFARENSELLCIPGEEYLAFVRSVPVVNSNQTEALIGYYLEMVRRQISLPMMDDAEKIAFDRQLLKLAPMKMPGGRKAIPFRVESDILSVGFCLPLSTDFINVVKTHYAGYKIKQYIIDEPTYEALRKQQLSFSSGQGHLPSPTVPLKRVETAMDHQEDFEDLRSSSLMLSQLPAESFAQLIPYFRRADFAQGDVIFSPEHQSDHFYIVAAGQVELSKDVRALGTQVTFDIADQYDVFFNSTLFGQATSNITATARTACRVFSLPKNVLEALKQRSDFAIHFAITMAHVIGSLNKNAGEFEFFPEGGPQSNLLTQPLLPGSKVRQLKILPLELFEKDLTLGVLVPKQEILDDAIDSYLRGFNVRTKLITEESFASWTVKIQSGEVSDGTVTVFKNSSLDDRVLKTLSSDATVALEQVLDGAMTSRASDIHFEPGEKLLVVRYRIDGVLMQLWDNVAIEAGLNILRRIKVLAKMNISETRLPQDGQFKFQKSDRESSYRVSSVPTRFGEKLVLRTTGRKNAVVPLPLLAPHAKITKFFNRLVKFQQGIFFITGPTGSGKSTTMYSILSELNTRDKNIITIEDPIEANISGINQIEINPSIGLTHESILRNVLRQDPDVIMIGEIRDSVSMQLALDAALAGQLVLTTLHASNSFEVIPRIKELGGTTSHIASGLIGVLAQRLVRKLCDCKKPRAISMSEVALFRELEFTEPLTHIMDAVGCAKCNYTGFSGQIPLFEFWEKTARVHNILLDHGESEELIRAIRESNLESLAAYGLKMVSQGLTTVSEVNDVLFGITDLMAS